MRLALSIPIVILRRQVMCLVLAAILAAFIWGYGQQFNFATIFLYSILIGNLTIPLTEGLHRVCGRYSFPYDWLIFLPVLALLLPLIYVVSSVVVWWLAPPVPQQLSHLILTGWKLPVVVAFIFSVIIRVYLLAQEQLKQRNRELEHSVEQRSAELKLQEKELERAREIQQSLLPREIPQVAGFEVAGTWQPARMVSGDYYDVFKLDNSRLALCIADVVGKGVSAALLMANVQAAVRAFSGSADSPARLCEKVNKLLYENIAVGKFVTFLYGVLDREAMTFSYCNAGHMPPILITNAGSQSMCEGGAVLGVFQEWQYQDSKVELRSGDRLLLYTDGITEATDANEQEFGELNLANALQRHSGRSAVETSNLLLEQVSSFCGAHFQDDATLLVVVVE